MNLPHAFRLLSLKLQDFEASASVANTGTGSRREGEQFEHLIRTWWIELGRVLSRAGATGTTLSLGGQKHYQRLEYGKRVAYLPGETEGIHTAVDRDEMWFQTTFRVDEMLASFPGVPEVIARYAPSSGPFSGEQYPNMYSGMTTRFDDTMVLEDSGVMAAKVLLEYKTAKSSVGRQIDGNAHERLSFQMMQYLEVATRYPRCDFMVMANGAFSRYRNKYHPNFHVQADRLKAFSWFSMRHMCTADEFDALADRVFTWLVEGGDWSR